MDSNDLRQSAMEAASSFSGKVMGGGVAAAVYGGYTATEIAAFGGLLIALLGFGWKLYLDNQMLKIARERAKHSDQLDAAAIEEINARNDRNDRNKRIDANNRNDLNDRNDRIDRNANSS